MQTLFWVKDSQVSKCRPRARGTDPSRSIRTASRQIAVRDRKTTGPGLLSGHRLSRASSAYVGYPASRVSEPAPPALATAPVSGSAFAIARSAAGRLDRGELEPGHDPV